MQEDFGVMTSAYHVSRTDIILWINELLKTKVHCIEQLGTGAVHCQILDYYFPGSLSMGKVSWKAKTSWEFVANFKVLQQGFDNLGLKKKIDVERLTAAKYQDNLEFAQWIKQFCDINGSAPEGDYDGPGRRKKQSLFYRKNLSKYKSLMAMARKSKAKQEKDGRKKSSSNYSKSQLKRKKTFENGEKRKQAMKDRKDIEFVLATLNSEKAESEMVNTLKAHFGLKISEKEPKSESEPESENDAIEEED